MSEPASLSGGVLPAEIRRVAVVSAGVIGAGWVTRFLAQGLEVSVWDLAPEVRSDLKGRVAAVWPQIKSLGNVDDSWEERLLIFEDLEAAVEGAAFVQESAPETMSVKQTLFSDLDSVVAPDVVIASSTSGFLMTEMASAVTRSQRFVVGHPFNPPYLIPFVEVVPGELTSPHASQWAFEFYKSIGMSPVLMQREVPGFIGNRLQEALWREGVHMVAAGEATVEQIDLALTHALGPRWSLIGPFLTFHLAGGAGGMADYLEKYSDLFDAPWTRLASPPITEDLKAAIVNGVNEEMAGRSISELIAWRDASLVQWLNLLSMARENTKSAPNT